MEQKVNNFPVVYVAQHSFYGMQDCTTVAQECPRRADVLYVCAEQRPRLQGLPLETDYLSSSIKRIRPAAVSGGHVHNPVTSNELLGMSAVS